MKTTHPFPFAVLFAVVWVIGAVTLAQTLPSGFASMPDGVSVQAFGDDGYRVFSIASVACNANTPAALSAARTVATAKAKAALARFLDETVSVDEFVERESVRVQTADGVNVSSAKADIRRTLVRIKTESHALLRGVKVIGTERVPDSGGGGTLRLVAAVDSGGIRDAERLEDSMRARGGSF